MSLLDWITAGGTASAAGFTAVAARAANRAASTAHAALAAESRPLLLTVKHRNERMEPVIGTDQAVQALFPLTRLVDAITYDAAEHFLSIPVRNVGRGAARVSRVTVSIEDGPTWAAQLRWPVYVPVGEQATVSPMLDPESDVAAVLADPPPGTGLTLVIPFTDLAGEEVGTLTAALERVRAGRHWVVEDSYVEVQTDPARPAGAANFRRWLSRS